MEKRNEKKQMGALGRTAHFLLLAMLASPALALAEEGDDTALDRTGTGQWRFWGGNLKNTHFAESERAIGPGNVDRLTVQWTFAAAGSVSAYPIVTGDRLYFTDWGPALQAPPLFPGGKIHALDRKSGQEIWSRWIRDYSGSPYHNLSRSSPVVFEDLLLFGDQVNAIREALPLTSRENRGASLYAVNRETGELVWRARLDDHPLSVATQSPVLYQGRVYVGVSSVENILAPLDPAYPCCSFRGSLLALDARSGKILWKSYMVPDNGGRTDGFSGAGVWGSTPVIDQKRNLVYITTGQNYKVPESLQRCFRNPDADPAAVERCRAEQDPADNRFNSFVALDLDTGAVVWTRKLSSYDAWTLACVVESLPLFPFDLADCPDPAGSDYDFGQGPMLISFDDQGARRELLVAGQKSGFFWALDPDRQGEVVWSTRVGPGGLEGGHQWGSAFDGQRIYTQVTNFAHAEFPLTAGPYAGLVANGGFWAALDPRTGAILWQTPDPASSKPLTGDIEHPRFGLGRGLGFFAWAMGPLTVANGVVYAGSMDFAGHMYAMDAEDGRILWRFASGGSVCSAPAVVDGILYWGSGYPRLGWPNNKLYAFALGR